MAPYTPPEAPAALTSLSGLGASQLTLQGAALRAPLAQGAAHPVPVGKGRGQRQAWKTKQQREGCHSAGEAGVLEVLLP